MKLDKIFFISLSFCFFYLTSVFAIDFKKSDIRFIGNKSISKDTILNYTDPKKEILNTDDLNFFQKKLFETNFFSKVEVKISGTQVSFYLNENPLIEYIVLTGLEKRDDVKKKIEKIISLKENNIFSESLLNTDVKLIYELLSSMGYFQSNVEHLVKKITNNKVNVFLDIKLNQKFLVKDIFFLGDKKLSTSTLKSAISTAQDSWLNFLSSNTTPSVDRISYDISLLKKLYLSKGYYDVQISNGSIDIFDKKYANITFVINAGNKYFFDEILVNNSSLSVKEKDLLFILEKAKSIEKENYNPLLINGLVKTFKDYFNNKSILVNLDYNLKKISLDRISIVFSVSDISEKRFVNNITVKGNDLTEEKVIRDILLFSEGDLFNSADIVKSIDSLKDSRFFKTVKIDSEDIKNSKNINIVVFVEEKPTGEISAGAGYGTEGGVINFSVKENNFLGKGVRADASAVLGTQKVLGKITLSDPHFTANGNSLSGSFFVSEYTYNNAGYSNKVIGSAISTGYDVFKNTNLQSGFSADFDRIDSENGSSAIIKSHQGDYITAKIFYNISNDMRNRKFQPTSGYTAGFGQGLATFVSDVPYLTNTLFGSFYHEFTEDFLGTVKYKVKSINSIGSKDVKLSDRIFLSAYELRGFALRGTGPKVANEFIGGNYSYSTNFSSTIPNGLPDKWGAKTNIFFDVANIWGTDFALAADNDSIRSSAGVGLEWGSPLGPLSFTYAIPISKDPQDSIENFNFRLGGTF